MMRKNILSVALAMLALGAASAQDAWATFRGNNARTGNTDGKAGPGAPALLWTMKSDEHFVAAPVPVGNQLFFSSVGAFNKPNVLMLPSAPREGTMNKPNWQKTAPFLKFPSVSSPATVDGKVIFGEGMHQTDGAILYCLPADGGPLLWAYNMPGELVHMEGAPTVVKGKVYSGAGSGGVFCVDLNTVTLNGKDLDVKAIPALQEERMKVLKAKYEEDKKKDPDFAIPPSEADLLKPSPKLHWQVGKGKWHVDAPVLVVGDNVLVASAFLDKEKLGDRALYCLDATTGKEKWRTPLTLNPWGGPSVIGDTVVITTSSISYDPKATEGAKGEIMALDMATGKEKWKKNLPGGCLSCAALTADSAVFTCTDGKLRVFSLKDGSRVSIYDAKASLFSAPAVVGNVAYIADNKGTIHAVDIKSGTASWTFDLAKEPVKLPGMNYGGLTVNEGKIYFATCNLEGPFARQGTMIGCLGTK